MENKCKDCHYWRDTVGDLNVCIGYCALYGGKNPERCGCPMWVPGGYINTKKDG